MRWFQPLVHLETKREHVVMAPTEQTLTMYRTAAGAYRHTRRVLRAHECMWAAAGAVKALRPNLAAEAIQWVGINPLCNRRTAIGASPRTVQGPQGKAE